jgi:hypothetical protein
MDPRRPHIVPPPLPEPAGQDVRKVAFFREAATGFEFMALWHSLDAQAQAQLREAIQAAAAGAAQREVERR